MNGTHCVPSFASCPQCVTFLRLQIAHCLRPLFSLVSSVRLAFSCRLQGCVFTSTHCVPSTALRSVAVVTCRLLNVPLRCIAIPFFVCWGQEMKASMNKKKSKPWEDAKRWTADVTDHNVFVQRKTLSRAGSSACYFINLIVFAELTCTAESANAELRREENKMVNEMFNRIYTIVVFVSSVNIHSWSRLYSASFCYKRACLGISFVFVVELYSWVIETYEIV